MKVLVKINGKEQTYNSVINANKYLGFSVKNAMSALNKGNAYVIQRGKDKGAVIYPLTTRPEYVLKIKHGGEYWYNSLETLLTDVGIDVNDKSVRYKLKYIGIFNDEKGNIIYCVQR